MFFDFSPSIDYVDKYNDFSHSHCHSGRSVIKIKYTKLQGIYLWINNINNKSYIGKYVNLYSRLSKYFSSYYLKNNKLKMAICGAISKHGINNFTLYILEIVDKEKSKEFLSER